MSVVQIFQFHLFLNRHCRSYGGNKTYLFLLFLEKCMTVLSSWKYVLNPTELFVNRISFGLVLFSTHVLNTWCSKWSAVNGLVQSLAPARTASQSLKRISRQWLFCRRESAGSVYASWYLLSTLEDFTLALLIFQWKMHHLMLLWHPLQIHNYLIFHKVKSHSGRRWYFPNLNLQMSEHSEIYYAGPLVFRGSYSNQCVGRPWAGTEINCDIITVFRYAG